MSSTTHSEAASIVLSTVDQKETDRVWAALIADGGSESRCGWLKDRFGVSWQIVPAEVSRMLSSDDRQAADRAMAAVMEMGKIELEPVRAAYDGGSSEA